MAWRRPAAALAARSSSVRLSRVTLGCSPATRKKVTGVVINGHEWQLQALTTQVMGRSDYERLADDFLFDLEDAFNDAGIDDMNDNFDIVLSQGVLTINLAEHGTWVFNKQAPNRQIWWSSPLSGPKRFAYDASKQQWLDVRDGKTEFRNLLNNEMLTALGCELND